MNYNKKIALIGLGSLLLLALPRANAQVITEWNFDNLTAGTTNLTPAPSTGSGTASSLGMGLYGGGDNSNIYNLTGTGSDNSGSSNNTWRIVGGATGSGNGWNSGAAIGTQGAQFDVNTSGYSNINLTFDVSISSQGEANLQVEYSTNGGTSWVNASTLTYTGTPVSPATGTILTNTTATNANIVNGTYFHGEANNGNDVWYNGLSVNLSGVTAANNDPNLEFEIVNAATGTSDVNEKGNTALNNTSGNWRFDDVTISSVAAVPEPSSWALAVIVVIAFVGLRRRVAGRVL
jgi:hypothetical protein